MIKWLKNRMIGLALATSKIEKNALNNEGNMLSDDIGTNINTKKDTLSYDLINGVLSQEVKDLRWRMYKTLSHMDKHRKRIIGYEEDYDPENKEYFMKPIMGDDLSPTIKLKKVKIDDYDSEDLTMVIYNTEVTLGQHERLTEEEKTVLDKKVEFELHEVARFKPQNFLVKLNLRKITDEEYLGELYFSKYHDGYDPTHSLFVKELERCFNKKQIDYLFDLKEIGFITMNDLGVDNDKGFLFDIIKFDKIIEFNGYYVVKYKLKPQIFNYDTFEKFKEDALDEKYNKVEERKHKK